MQLEELNDDCLNHVFDFLAFKDVIRLNLASRRFCECAQHWITKHEFLMLPESFRDMEPRDFFSVFGQYIKRIIIEHAKEHLNLLPKYCNNVEYISIRIDKSEKGQLSFIGRMQSLRELKIVGRGLNLTGIKEIIKLRDLERLHINDAYVTGYRLNKLKKLTQLNLSDCIDVTTKYLIQVFLANANLTSINVIGCSKIGREAYRCIVQESRLLESLEFSADTLLDGEFIPGLNHLKQLTIVDVDSFEFGQLLLEKYSKALGQTLTSLTCGNWSELSFPQHFSFPNLVKLNICDCTIKVDVVLRSLCNSFPRLETVTIWNHYDDYNATPDAILDFFRQSKSVELADIPILKSFNVDMYKEIVRIRQAFNSVKTLKLLFQTHELMNCRKYAEIKSFMKGNDYIGLRKLVQIELKGTISCESESSE